MKFRVYAGQYTFTVILSLALFLEINCTTLNRASAHSSADDSGPADMEEVESTLNRIQSLRRTLAALQDAGMAEKSAAKHEKAIGDSKLKLATSSARQAAKLMSRAATLLRSEEALKSEQARFNSFTSIDLTEQIFTLQEHVAHELRDLQDVHRNILAWETCTGARKSACPADNEDVWAQSDPQA